MDNLIKWGLVGLGAYLLYENFLVAPASATTVPTPTTTTSVPVSVQPATLTQEEQALNLLNAMGSEPVLIAAQNAKDPAFVNNMLTAWQWDWYLNQVADINPNSANATTGPQLFSYLSTGANTAIPLASWWAAVMQWAQNTAAQSVAASPTTASTGVSGLGGLGYRDATETTHFAAPPDRGEGRFDFVDTGWA